MNKYFLQKGDEYIGPFNFEELKTKEIEKNTLVWFEGLKDWTRAEEINELKNLFVLIPPPIKKTQVITSKISEIPPPLPKTVEEIKNAKKNFDINKINKSLIYWIIAGILIASLIIFLVVKNNQNKKIIETVNNVNQQLNTEVDTLKQAVDIKKQEIQKQAFEKAKQEAEKQRDEEERQNRFQELEEKKLNYRNNWSSFITSETGTYSYREIGGIFNLGVSVSNSTEYMIDEVIVEINYLKANGGIYKTEIATLYYISPYDSKRVAAPDSDRGTSVTIKIVKIKANAFNFCYDYYGGGNGNQNDKWECN